MPEQYITVLFFQFPKCKTNEVKYQDLISCAEDITISSTSVSSHFLIMSNLLLGVFLISAVADDLLEVLRDFFSVVVGLLFWCGTQQHPLLGSQPVILLALVVFYSFLHL